MHLSPSQCKRFYKLFYSLLDYANVTFDILSEPFVPYAGELGTQKVTTLVHHVFEENPAAIDRYISENPDRLSASDLEQIDSWHNALFGRFILIEHKAAHAAFLAEDCIFNVIGLTMNLHKVLPNAPTVAETVLLPFDRYIVYGVNITEYNLDLAPEFIDALYDEYHRLLDEQRVATSAQEFLVEASLCRQRRAENVKLLRELRGGSGDDDFGFGSDDLDPGEFSVSPLAGLNSEQRRAAIDEYLADTNDDGILASDFSAFVIPGEPVRTIAESLISATKEELADLCRTFRIKGFSKLNKKGLVELVEHAVELEAYNYNKRIESLPSYLALQDFLDRHIPFDQDEYLFADYVLDELITMVCLEYDPADITDCLMDWGLDFGERSDDEAMFKLLTDFFNDIPLWANNGWSATELAQRGSQR